jgi:hypothetical protein
MYRVTELFVIGEHDFNHELVGIGRSRRKPAKSVGPCRVSS